MDRAEILEQARRALELADQVAEDAERRRAEAAYAPEPIRPLPLPPETASAHQRSPDAAALTRAMVRALVQQALDERLAVLPESIGEALGAVAAELRKEFRDAIAELRNEVRGIVSDEPRMRRLDASLAKIDAIAESLGSELVQRAAGQQVVSPN